MQLFPFAQGSEFPVLPAYLPGLLDSAGFSCLRDVFLGVEPAVAPAVPALSEDGSPMTADSTGGVRFASVADGDFPRAPPRPLARSCRRWRAGAEPLSATEGDRVGDAEALGPADER